MVEMNDADLAAWRAGGHVSLSHANSRRSSQLYAVSSIH
jgi:hypothetical protein